MMILSALIYFVNFELYYYYIVSMQYQNPIIKKISYIFERECTFFHYESSYLFFPPLSRRCPSLRKQRKRLRNTRHPLIFFITLLQDPFVGDYLSKKLSGSRDSMHAMRFHSHARIPRIREVPSTICQEREEKSKEKQEKEKNGSRWSKEK